MGIPVCTEQYSYVSLDNELTRDYRDYLYGSSERDSDEDEEEEEDASLGNSDRHKNPLRHSHPALGYSTLTFNASTPMCLAKKIITNSNIDPIYLSVFFITKL